MPLECLAKEPLGSTQITPLAKPVLDCIAAAVDGAVQVHPSPAHPDIGLIHMPSVCARALAPVESL